MQDFVSQVQDTIAKTDKFGQNQFRKNTEIFLSLFAETRQDIKWLPLVISCDFALRRVTDFFPIDMVFAFS